MSFKFIHAADIHLDSPLKGLERYEGAPVEEIRGATRRALENLVQLAIDEAVAFVVIAGDIYDGDWKDFGTGLFFVQQMLRLREAGISVVTIQGNHDAENRMSRSLNLPDNVTELPTKKPKTVMARELGLAHLDVAFHGQGFATPSVTENVVPSYPLAERNCFNIGLLHTSLDYESESEGGHSRYAPCKQADLVAKGYQYWALGHIHQREIRRAETLVAFSGNIQGRHIREQDEKGCLLVTVDESRPIEVVFRPLDVMRWVHCEISAAGAKHPGDLLERFAEDLRQKTRKHEGLPLAVRVTLSGACAAHGLLAATPERWTNEIRSVALEASGGAAWVEKVRVCTSLPISTNEHLADGPIAELLRTLADLGNDEAALQCLSNELADLRRKLPAELTQGDDNLQLDDPTRLREYLAEVEPLLLARFAAHEDGA